MKIREDWKLSTYKNVFADVIIPGGRFVRTMKTVGLQTKNQKPDFLCRDVAIRMRRLFTIQQLLVRRLQELCFQFHLFILLK